MAESIKTTELDVEDGTEKSACSFCLKEATKYTCPRCNIGYCSVDCYKSPKHSNCSEEFYKQCFMEGLKDSEADPQDKQRVLEMLKRAENDPDLNDLDQPEDDLKERLNDLDLDKDTDKIWNRLTDQEKREFEAMAGDGRLWTLVELWTPWWQTKPPLVQEVVNQSTKEEVENQSEAKKDENHSDKTQTVTSQTDQSKQKKKLSKSKLVNKSGKSKLVKPSEHTLLSESDITTALNQSEQLESLSDGMISGSCKPTLKTDIQNISDLIHKKPSADIRYNMLNILYSYVFICRLHNGEHVSMATDSAEDFLEISDVMSQGQNFGSTREAIQACLSRIQSRSSFQTTQEYNISIMEDIVNLISSSESNNPVHSVLLALSDTSALFRSSYKTCSKKLKSEKADSKKDKLKLKKTRLFKCMKKCEFFLSWAQTYGVILVEMVPEIQLELSFLSGELEVVNLSKQQLESEWGGKTKPKKKQLVEEI